MRPKDKVAYRRIEAFRRRFGEAHLNFAYHAAFPLALTPDLLYRLWSYFRRDIQGEVLNISWIAVSDLLLSSLCDEVGYELYEMKGEVRSKLLKQLSKSSRFGTQRINDLSDFLLTYVKQQIDSPDLDTRDFAQAQRWTALAYTRPNEAARELAQTLSELKFEERSEWVRVSSLVETFAEPLVEENFEPLLVYARGMSSWVRGNKEAAKEQLKKYASDGKIQVAGVDLPVPRVMHPRPASDKREPSPPYMPPEGFQEKHRSYLAIKQGLPAQSLGQLKLRQDELAALLARQAYYFNQQDRLHVLAQVDNALRQVLSAPYFSNVLKYHPLSLSSIAFSPDGTKLAAGSWDGNIYLWNQEQSYSEFKPLAGHRKGINAIAFSPNGQWLASGSRDKTVRLWDLSQNDPVSKVIGKHEKDVTSIAFNPDGSLLASGSKDRTVKLWNWHQLDRSPIVLAGHSSKGEMGMIRSLTFSPYGSQLAVGCENTTIWLWDVQEPTSTPDKEPILRYGHEGKIRSVAFSPGGRWLASASDDQTIRLWDINQPQEPPQILKDHTAKVRSLSFSPDGKMLASSGDDQTIRLWKTDKLGQTDKLGEAFQILRGHTFNITSVAFSPDSQYLASCGWDNTVRLWDLNPPIAAPKILPRHQNTVRAIAIIQQDREEQILASGSEDGTVRVWNLNQLDAEPKTFVGCRRVFGVALFVSRDSQVQLLAAGSDDKIVRLWDLQQSSDLPPRKFTGHLDGVSSVAFSPDGQWLASGSWDTTVRLWNLNQLDGEPIILKGHTDSVTSVKFSPDGKILASASDDNRVLLWNTEQPAADPIELKNHSGRVWSIAFSPHGKYLASASDDWTVRLWNLEKLDLENPDPNKLVDIPLKGHSAWVSSVAFSPDGKVLASGSFDRSIRLWQIDQIDWKAGKINESPIVLEDHNQSVTSVAFTPDGKYLASGSFDNTVRLWIASTHMLADMVCQKVLRNLTMQEWQEFMGDDILYEKTCPNLPLGEGILEVARSEEVSKLESEFRDKLAQLFPGQKDVLEFIEQITSQQSDISEEDVTNFLNKPKGDAETFYRLETLRLLGFLEITKSGDEPGTIRYGLSPRYRGI